MAGSTAMLPAGSRPVPRTRLFGRVAERGLAHRLLIDEAVPLLTLTGSGGVGKTRLALAVAADVAEHFGDGVTWVDLAPLADAAQVPSKVANALGIALGSEDAVEAQIAQHLRPRQALLLFDNCEHLIDGVAELTASLLTSCPALQVLATSRASLRIRGEHDLALPPLPLPNATGQATAPPLADNPAVQLFVERARAANATFPVDKDALAEVAEICRMVDGLPLAIELAAASVRVLPLATLRDRLQRRLPLPGGGTRDAPARQRTMRDTVGWSYDLLTPAEQRLFRRLAVFVGGLTLEAAETIGTSSRDLRGDVVGGIAALLDSNLLRQESSTGGEPRYRMLETIREYGLEQLEASGEATTARDAHAAFFVDLAERAAPKMLGGNPVAWLHRLADDHDNVNAALDWLCSGDTPRECARLAGARGWYWYRWGHVREGRTRLARAIPDAGPEPNAALGHALYWAAELAIRAGDVDAAASLAQEALAVWEEVGDSLGRALAVHALARVAQYHGHWEAAARLYEEELPVWRETGNPRAIGMVLVELGEVAFGQGDMARAHATMHEAAATFRQANERTWLAATDLYLALFAVAEGRFAEAARRYRSCLSGYAETGDAFLQSPLAGLARVAVEADRPATAAQLLGAVDAELERTGMRFDAFERVGRDEAEASARATLGEETFIAAYTSGRTLSRDAWAEAADDIVSALEAGDAAHPRRGDWTMAGLTRRERDILALVAEGFSDRDVAAALFITQGTVRSHLTSIFGKLEVGSRTAAVAAARRLGIL